MSDTKTRDTGVLLTYINNNHIHSDGGTPVTGFIDMDGNTLYNVSDPVNLQYVATKGYTDKRTYVIAAHASYSGPLIRNKHQFTFGGNELHNPVTGFLVPQSGRIQMKTPINKKSLEDRLIKRNKIDIGFARNGFFSFTRVRNGEYIHIGTIRCQEAYKTYYQGIKIGPGAEDKEIFTVRYLYDFCFEDDLPI